MILDSELEKERVFQEWLESINFVDKNGVVVPPTLTEDDSNDPEGDREEE